MQGTASPNRPCRRQFPIEPAEPTPNPHAISCLGASPTPEAATRGHARREPASEKPAQERPSVEVDHAIYWP